MAFLARCPECNHFQVCVLDLDSKVNLKCRTCGTVFPSVTDEPISPPGVNWALAITLRPHEFEPPRPSTANLVIVQDLPSIYPRPKRRRRRVRRRRIRVPVAPGELTPTPTPTDVPEAPEFEPEPAAVPTEEAAGDGTAPNAEESPVAVAPAPVVPTIPPVFKPSPPKPVARPFRKKRDQDEEVEYGRLQLNATSIVALFLLVGGLMAASFALFRIVFWPLLGLSVLVSFLAIRSAVREGRRLLIPTATAVIGAIAVLVALTAPGLFGPGASRTRKPGWANEIMVIPNPQFAADPRVRNEEWVDASKASIQQGGTRVEIVDVRIGKVADMGSENHLLVRVRVYRNSALSGTQGSAFSWNDNARAVLRDASNIQYDQQGVVREGSTSGSASAHFQPGHEIVDTSIAFPVPADLSSAFFLELSAEAWGGNGAFKFAIPPSKLKR